MFLAHLVLVPDPPGLVGAGPSWAWRGRLALRLTAGSRGICSVDGSSGLSAPLSVLLD